jgi:hypothetical protein
VSFLVRALTVVSVAPDNGRLGDRLYGFEPEAGEVDAETPVPSAGAVYGLRRPRDPPCDG